MRTPSEPENKSDNEEPVTPKPLHHFLWVVGAVSVLAAVGLLLNWVFLLQWEDWWVAHHPGQFKGTPHPEIAKKALISVVILRSVFALGWIATFMRIRNYVKRGHKWLYATAILYAAVGACGYAVMVTQGGPIWQTVVRCTQALLCLALLVYLLLPQTRTTVKAYVARSMARTHKP